jgi:hypothetical protein
MSALKLRHSFVFLSLVLVSCGKGPEAIAPAEPQGQTTASSASATLEIRELFPPMASAGVPFQTIHDGSSTIGVAGSGFTKSSQVFFNDRPLQTNYQSPKAVAAIVPRDLTEIAQTVSITVRDRNPDRGSQPAMFRILPPRKVGDPVVIKELYPPSSKAGTPFGVQPDGQWAIGIAGNGFDPKSLVVFDGVELQTVFQSPVAMAAFVPQALVAKARRVKVVIRDRDSKKDLSPPAVFDVQP